MNLVELCVKGSVKVQDVVRPNRFKDVLPNGGKEADIEQLIVDNPGLLNMGDFSKGDGISNDLLIIARQPRTSTRKRADLFAIDREGALVIIEVKRDAEDDRVRREALEFQAIRYAASSRKMTYEAVEVMYAEYLQKLDGGNESSDVFRERGFERIRAHIQDDDEELSREDVSKRINPRVKQRIYIVAADIDPDAAAAFAWLREHNIDIVVFRLQPYRLGEGIYLSRERLIPPPELDEFYLDMATLTSRAAATESVERKSTDKPLRLRFMFGDEEIVLTVNSWRDAFVKTMRQVVEFGLDPSNLPGVSAEKNTMRSAEEIAEGKFVESHGSARDLKGKMCKALISLKAANPTSSEEILEITTRSGVQIVFPRDEE